MELYGALAILMVMGCFVALTLFFIRALRIEFISIKLIGYELLTLISIILSSFIVDYKLFSGGYILNPLFGQSLVDNINGIFNSMGYASSFVMFMVLSVVLIISFVAYYIHIVKPEAR